MSLHLAVLTNELPPYRRPIFEQLAADGSLRITALLNTSAEEGRPWEGPGAIPGVDVRMVRSVSRRVHQAAEGGVRRERMLQIPLSMRQELIQIRPDVILSGEFGARSAAAALYARQHRVPLILWSEETDRAARSANLTQRALRRWLFRRADAFVAFGNPARDYLRGQGVPSFRIFVGAQAVDHAWWTEHAEAARSAPAPFEHPGKLVLAVGQLVPRKGFDVLLRAWARLPRDVPTAHTLAIAGGGESESALKTLATVLGVPDVRFLGPQSAEALAALYAHADLFVLPTWLDVWGLVVNEAMACGLPALVSKGAGASEELVEPGVTGDVFEPGDIAKLAQLLEAWLAREVPRPLLAAAAQAQVPSFEKAVESIRSAIDYVTRPNRPAA